MKKLFGIKIGPPAEIIASLPVLDALNENIGKTYNIFALGKKYSYFSIFLENHPLINEIKVSEHDENLGESDFDLIKKCDYFINPTPPHLKENDWYNYRTFVQETSLNATIDFNLIKTLPKLYKNFLNKKIYKLGIFENDDIGPSKKWWKEFKNKINVDFINLNNYNNFLDQVNAGLSCEIILSSPSDLSWTLAAFNKNYLINLVSRHKKDHISNITSLAPIGENAFNLIDENDYDHINIDETIEMINNLLYNR